MDISINNSRFSENGIIWAIAASILLHVLITVVVPNFDFSIKKKQPRLIKVELQKPTPPIPAPIIEPLPPIDIPEPVKPKPIKKKPVVKPKPIKKEAPAPIEPPEEVAPPPVVEEVIAVQPTINKEPAIVVPEPTPEPIEPPPPPPPSKVDRDNALSAYSSKLGRAIAKYKSYPKLAQRRGWQGTVLLAIKVDNNGNVLSATVSKSSGHATLDKSALKMVKKASPFPAPPSILQGDSFTISVPVVFKLKNG